MPNLIRSIDIDNIAVDEKNRWHLETPCHAGWVRTARPDDPNRYLMLSADYHRNEPSILWYTRLDERFRKRAPHIEVDEKGDKWLMVGG